MKASRRLATAPAPVPISAEVASPTPRKDTGTVSCSASLSASSASASSSASTPTSSFSSFSSSLSPAPSSALESSASSLSLDLSPDIPENAVSMAAWALRSDSCKAALEVVNSLTCPESCLFLSSRASVAFSAAESFCASPARSDARYRVSSCIRLCTCDCSASAAEARFRARRLVSRNLPAPMALSTLGKASSALAFAG
mmetsp:Transcript_74659/g.139390  ORF Transcript_74659/g.139390 Transcript_74659/m.139390 type:complete len:200 (+) Transcript_74659:396-995(+)